MTPTIRRAAMVATIALSAATSAWLWPDPSAPNLAYRPVRAETFWSYYRGQNPLFDDLFAGRGLFISQETATTGPAAKAGAFWSGVWNGVLKVFGL